MQVKKNKIKLLRDNAVAYSLLAPAVFMFVFFVLVPAVQTIYISFTKWDGIGPKTFVGLQNYREMLADNDVYWISLKNNIIWTVVSMTVPVWIGVFQANLLVRGGLRHAKIFQLIFFLPQIISTVVAAVAWKWIYDPVLGPLTNLLKALGIKSYASGILGDPKTVLAALCVVHIWSHYGFCCVVFSSAIQAIDKTLYEAAMADGASRTRQFWSITLPGIREAMTTVLVLTMMWSFKVFDVVYTMTKGGPGQHSYVIALYTFLQGFAYNRMGLASAITVSLTIICLVLSKVFVAVRERGRY